MKFYGGNINVNFPNDTSCLLGILRVSWQHKLGLDKVIGSKPFKVLFIFASVKQLFPNTKRAK